MYRFFILTLLLLLAACGATPTQPTVAPTVAVTETPTESPTAVPAVIATLPPAPAYIRLIHAAPQTEPVNVYLGEFLVASSLSFGVNTEKTEIPAGDYALRFLPAGATVNTAALYETDLSIQSGASLILVFTGTSDALTLANYSESNEPLGARESRVTVIHAVPRGVDFAIRQADTDLTSTVAFGQATSAVVAALGQTTLDFQAGETTLLSYPIELREGFNYTLVLVGRADDASSLTVTAFENRVPGLALIRGIHAAFEVSVVDFYVDGELISGGIEYARAGERISTAAGRRVAAVYEAGADPSSASPLFSQVMELQANTNIALILLGTPTTLRFLPFVEDLSPLPEGQVRLSFVNTLEDVSVIRVENINGTLEDVYYAQQGRDSIITAGVYTLFWNTMVGTPDTLEIGSELQFEAGRLYLYLFTGRDLSNPPLIFSENVGTEGSVSADEVPSIQARFINTIPDGSVVDFVVAGNIVASGLAYGQSSEMVTLSASEYPITIRSAGMDITTDEYMFSEGSTHSVFAIGDTVASAQIRGLPDTFTQEQNSASVRLINLSVDSLVEFGLAYSTVTVSSAPAGVVTEQLDNPSFRQSLPLDTQIIIDGLGNRSGEFVTDTVAIPVGIRDVYVLDSVTQQVAAYVGALPLEAGLHYDIVAFQSSSSPQVRAFVVIYPVIEQ